MVARTSVFEVRGSSLGETVNFKYGDMRRDFFLPTVHSLDLRSKNRGPQRRRSALRSLRPNKFTASGFIHYVQHKIATRGAPGGRIAVPVYTPKVEIGVLGIDGVKIP